MTTKRKGKAKAAKTFDDVVLLAAKARAQADTLGSSWVTAVGRGCSVELEERILERYSKSVLGIDLANAAKVASAAAIGATATAVLGAVLFPVSVLGLAMGAVAATATAKLSKEKEVLKYVEHIDRARTLFSEFRRISDETEKEGLLEFVFEELIDDA